MGVSIWYLEIWPTCCAVPILSTTTRNSQTLPPMPPIRPTTTLFRHATRATKTYLQHNIPPTNTRPDLDWSLPGMHHWPKHNLSWLHTATTHIATSHCEAIWNWPEATLLWVHSHSMAHISTTTVATTNSTNFYAKLIQQIWTTTLLVYYLHNTHLYPIDEAASEWHQLHATVTQIFYKENQDPTLQALITNTTVEAIMLKPAKYIWWWVLHSHSHIQVHQEVHKREHSSTHTISNSSLSTG